MPGQLPANKQELQFCLATNKFYKILPEIIQIKGSQNANSVSYWNNMATKNDFPKPMKGTTKAEKFPHLTKNANAEDTASNRESMETKNGFTEPSEVAEEFPHLTKAEFCKYVLKKVIPDPVDKDKIIIDLRIKNEERWDSYHLLPKNYEEWCPSTLGPLKKQIKIAELKAKNLNFNLQFSDISNL